MIKIGFVDYYLSEWHANNYPKWLAEACEKSGVQATVAYAWAEEKVSPLDGVTSEQWCEKYGAELCQSCEELCEKSDVILILAPSNPEKHLPYAKMVLPYGKRTYIDKTFAPNYQSAKEIFALAEQYHTPFFSTSALRYGEELGRVENCRHIMTLGSGSSIDEYIVHQLEMVVKKLGLGAESVCAQQIGQQTYFQIAYGDDRTAVMIYGAAGHPFAAHMNDGEGKATFKEIKSPFFNLLMEDVLHFFATGERSFNGEQTLEVIKVRDAVLKAVEEPGQWISVD